MAARKKKIADFLPDRTKPECNVLQAKVETELYTKTKEKMKRHGHTWDVLIEAMFKSYLAEETSEPS